MKIKQILFDQDGVLADFITGFKEVFDLPLEWTPSQYFLENDIDVSSDEMWSKIGLVEDWWINLKPIIEGISLLKWVISMGIDTMIATAPPLHDADVARQKIIWLK